MVPDGKALRLAVIPARGGSKRISRKNVKEFQGKPILAYSIEAAQRSGLFAEVMVSTEDSAIAELAEQYGAAVPFMRSAKAADDHAATIDVLLEVLAKYKEQGTVFSHVCCIYATAPFVTAEKLQRAFQLLEASGADSLIPVVQFSYPPLRGLTIEDEWLRMMWPENEFIRSQDLKPLYHDCGQFYCTRTEALLQEKTLFCKKTVPMQLPELEVQDIDNEIDWMLAEQKYMLLKKLKML